MYSNLHEGVLERMRKTQKLIKEEMKFINIYFKLNSVYVCK